MLCRIEINEEALINNYRVFQTKVGQSVVIPVLKSNAYGHGLKESWTILKKESPPWIAVNYIAEAEVLRSLGFRGRLLVVGPAVENGFAKADTLELDLVVGNMELLRIWATSPGKCRVHVKIDTGMSRQGILPENVDEIVEYFKNSKVVPTGVCTHFANVEDVTDQSYALLQMSSFETALAKFHSAGFNVLRHAASSASSLIMESSLFDLTRVGVSLYGVWPSKLTKVSYLQLHSNVVDLQPVLTWKTEITTLKKVHAGQYIGYGCTFRANREMDVAVLPVGYNEGYPRIAGEGQAYVLIKGERCPIVGRICMNMMMVDVSHNAKNLRLGEEVILIGTSGNETVSASDLANWSKTIHYEIFTKLHPDIPRVIV